MVCQTGVWGLSSDRTIEGKLVKNSLTFVRYWKVAGYEASDKQIQKNGKEQDLGHVIWHQKGVEKEKVLFRGMRGVHS